MSGQSDNDCGGRDGRGARIARTGDLGLGLNSDFGGGVAWLWRGGVTALLVWLACVGWMSEGRVGAAAVAEPARLIIALSAPGERTYAEQFSAWKEAWVEAGREGEAGISVVGEGDEAVSALDQLERLLKEEPKEGSSKLWIVLIGHGTFDGEEAKFNLRGPDLSASQLAEWLEPFERPVAVINTTASSAPFLNKLSRQGRVIITATRSGFEENFARLGRYLAEAMADLKADLDKDGQVSLLEAFLVASRQTAEFYELEGRLATEHPLIDDNGDGFGTPPDWFRGIRPVKKAKDDVAPDGFRAHQWHLVESEFERQMPPEIRARRDELELAVFRLRDRKAELDAEVYYALLEPLLLEMARLYESVETEGMHP